MKTNPAQKKIESAIAECLRYIEREEKRAADLRPADVSTRLEWYKAHHAKLVSMLEAR